MNEGSAQLKLPRRARGGLPRRDRAYAARPHGPVARTCRASGHSRHPPRADAVLRGAGPGAEGPVCRDALMLGSHGCGGLIPLRPLSAMICERQRLMPAVGPEAVLVVSVCLFPRRRYRQKSSNRSGASSVIANRVLDIFVAQICLQRARIMALVGQREAAGHAAACGMGLEAEIDRFACTLHHPRKTCRCERALIGTGCCPDALRAGRERRF